MVVPRSSVHSETTRELGEDLQTSSAAFAKSSGTEVAVGGPAGNLTDFTNETSAQIPLVVAALAVAVALVLMIGLRTIVLPLVAVAFDALTILATFGAMTLLFGGDDPLLGGPGYLDPMSIIGIFAAIFGISIAYEVLLLARTREHFAESGDARAALAFGLRRTAAVGHRRSRGDGRGGRAVHVQRADQRAPVRRRARDRGRPRRPDRAARAAARRRPPARPAQLVADRATTDPADRRREVHHDHRHRRHPYPRRQPPGAGTVAGIALLASGWREGDALTAPGREPISYAELGRAIREIAGGLAALGIERGDHVAILAGTRPEWTLADLGALCRRRHGRPDLPDQLARGVRVHPRPRRASARCSARTPGRSPRSSRSASAAPRSSTSSCSTARRPAR